MAKRNSHSNSLASSLKNIQLKTEFEQLKQDFETQKSHLTEIAEENAATREQYELFQENVGHLEEENETYWNMIQELESQLQEVSNTSHTQQEDLIKVIKENEAFRTAQEALEARFKVLEEHSKELEEKVAKSEDEKIAAVQELSNLELTRLNEYKSKTEAQELKLAELESSLQESEDNCIHLSEMVHELEGKLDNEQSSQSETILNLEAKLETALKSQRNQKQQIVEMDKNLRAVEEQLFEKKALFDANQAQLKLEIIKKEELLDQISKLKKLEEQARVDKESYDAIYAKYMEEVNLLLILNAIPTRHARSFSL